MKHFLRKVSEQLYPQFHDCPEQLCIVLPNRRSGVFLRKHWADLLDRPNWSPAIFSIEDFLAELSGLQIIDQLEQVFELYHVYKTQKGTDAESFEEFGRWAPVLLHDFNDIDANLADAPQLFANLSDVRSMETWNLGEGLTEFQQRYLKFWESLGSWHEALTKKLLQEGKAYPGLAARVAAHNAALKLAEKPWTKIIFAGFNGLTKAEAHILDILQSSGKGEAFWDADTYYIDDPAQEAGRFLRKHRDRFFGKPSPVGFPHVEKQLATAPKKIIIAGVARQISQAKAAAHLLDEWNAEGAGQWPTAIVLSDESLLFPVLHALPEHIDDVNVTMGYPMRNTPIAALSELLFYLQENARRFKIVSREGEIKLYHADVIRLLRHPYFRMLFRENSYADQLAHYIASKNFVFVAPSVLRNALPGLEKEFERIAPLFRLWADTNEAFDALAYAVQLFRYLFSGPGETPAAEPENDMKRGKRRANVELEFLFQYGKIIKRLRTLNQRFGFVRELRTLRGMMAQAIGAASLPFYGEPLTGLQVMGMLETRALDFDNLILLSVNENVLPAGRSHSSFIVYDLKRAFGLPVYHEQDATSAYNFYRLLQRATNVALLYNTEPDTFGNGERSRFIAQLIHELPHVNPNVVIEERLFDTGLKGAVAPAPIIIERNEAIQKRLAELGEYGLSPSLLNSFRKCSLQFYFRYVARLKEAEEVEETIGADTLGTVVHKVLEDLYRAHLGQPLTPALTAEMKKKATALAEEHFRSHYSGEELEYGKNLLTKKVSARFLSNFLDRERRLLEDLAKKNETLIVQELETELRAEIPMGNGQVVLRGHADRIDLAGNTLRIIDYKTGRADDSELRLSEWEVLQEHPGVDKSFQLLMYALMYARSGKPVTEQLLSGIITFRELKAGLKTVRTPGRSGTLDAEALAAFEAELLRLLQRLFDEKKPFVQTANLEVCEVCAFKGICNRE